MLTAVVALALPGAALSRSDAAPAAMVGTWSRTVTKADVARRGTVATGPWRFELKLSGALRLFNRSSTKPVATGRLTAGPSGTVKMLDLTVVGGGRCTEDVTYRWRLAAGRLTFSTAADKCSGRATVLVGTWRRAVPS
jgi:transposase InsO family protein